MASGLLWPLLSSVGKVLGLLRSRPAIAYPPPGGQSTVSADVQRLERLLRRIQATLDDAGGREVRDCSVKLWIEELTDVAREAEDVLDDVRYELLRRHVQELQGGGAAAAAGASTSGKRKHDEEEDGGICERIRKITRRFQISTDRAAVQLSPEEDDGDISEQIGEITRRFEEISKDRAALQLRPEDGERISGRGSKWGSRETSHLLDETLVFGRSKEKECIMKSLLCSSQGTGIHVLPIVGMGGIGKTTMARMVYNDGRVQNRFHLRGWVYVSEEFDLRRLTIAITESLTRKPCVFNELSSVHDVLKEEVNEKSVFLVLDDLWNELESCWQELLRPLKFARTVTILVTTRSKEVARIVQSISPFFLGSLPEDHCWLLFQHYAFGNRIIDENSSLVQLGRKIMQKCGGLPLAVKSIGCLLRSKMNMQTWVEISESEFWECSDDNEEIFSALRLSFYRLPERLKPCFLLCALYPKGQPFTKANIIHLWIAQGYIQSTRYKTPEEVANEYFVELNERSLIETDLGLCNCCRYKRLTRSTAETSSYQLLNTGQNFDVSRVRSLVETFREKTTKLYSAQSPLPIQLFKLHDMTWDLAKSLSRHVLSATANAEGTLNVTNKSQHLFLSQGSGIYGENSNWNHLRTLVLNDWSFYIIYVSTFSYLRALVLNLCFDLYCISGIRNMKHLRYLHIDNSCFNKEGRRIFDTTLCFPEAICHLYSLEKLVISTLQEFSIKSCNLISLRYLHLSFQFSDWSRFRFSELYNLDTLCLQSCGTITELPSCIGNLMNLRRLQLSNLTNIKRLNHHYFRRQNINNKCELMKSIFPSLEELEFDGLYVLQDWCGVLDSDCPKLLSLSIRNCCKLRKIPYIASVRELIISNIAITDLQLSVSNEPSQLNTLNIIDCQNLNSCIGLENLRSLESLYIANCPELIVSRKRKLPYKLHHVFIEDCPGLMEWCDEQKLYYQVPKIVKISHIKRAKECGIDYFQSFEHLSIDIFPEKGNELVLSPNNWLSSELRLLSFDYKSSSNALSFHEGLSTLGRLEIKGCPKLLALMDLDDLNVLHSLVIEDCPSLYMLPETKFPPQLTSLTVQGCHNLLSLHDFTLPSTLIDLEVSDCQGLVYIGGLRSLCNLESLLLLHCPLLQLQEMLPCIPEFITIFLCPKLKKWCEIQSIKYLENLPNSSCEVDA